MIKIINNFLQEDTLNKIHDFIKKNLQEPVWRNNLAWNTEIRKSSYPVWILPLNNNLNLEIKNNFIKHNFDVNNLKITAQFYCWTPLSYIPFHNDDQKKLSATIYLNKIWKKDWGGLFIYEEKDNLQAIAPSFNKCIINNSFVEHSVTLTTIDSPYRETIQIFFSDVQS
jgi:Rps23 Pro-64 3,4-dihydroxylase Tpa1-like proline 4-hydroxylase